MVAGRCRGRSVRRARVLGLVQLVVLAGIGLLLLAVAAVWVRYHPVHLDASRQLRERLQVGVDGRVDVVVEATSGRRMPTLSVSDAFDRGRRAARFLLAPLEPGEDARAAYRFPTDRRGRFEVGPLRATVTDPFGLASRTRRVLGTEEVIVYPRVHDIMAPPETGGVELDRDMPRAHGRLDPSGEFLTLRDYAPGDDLRHVHWRSTARRGRLMMRQNEARRRTPVLVMLDVRPGAHDRASFERAVEASRVDRDRVRARGPAVRGDPEHRRGGRRAGPASPRERDGRARGRRAARPRPDRRDDDSPPHQRARRGHGPLRGDDSGALGVLLRGGGVLTVVTTMPEGAGVWVRSRRFRPIVVPYGPDDSLTDSWNEAVLRWQRSARLPCQHHARGPDRRRRPRADHGVRRARVVGRGVDRGDRAARAARVDATTASCRRGSRRCSSSRPGSCSRLYAVEPDTTRHGLPTSDTFRQYFHDLGDAPHVLRTAVVPVPAVGSALLLALVALWFAGAIAEWSARRSTRRSARSPRVSCCSSRSPRSATSGWVVVDRSRTALAATLYLVALHQSELTERRSWFHTGEKRQSKVLQGGIIGALVVVLAAAVIAPLLPGSRSDAWFDYRSLGKGGNSGLLKATTPIVSIQAKLLENPEHEVFTVDIGDKQPVYWRVIALDKYDGTLWTLEDTGEPAARLTPPREPRHVDELVQKFDIRDSIPTGCPPRTTRSRSTSSTRSWSTAPRPST